MSDPLPGSASLASDDSQIVPQLNAGRFPARLRFILHVVECCFSSHVTDNLIYHVFTNLLLGMDDIWMWIDGDECRCSALKLGDGSMRRFLLLPRLMSWSLRRENWEIPCLQAHTLLNEAVVDHRRLEEASFRMRLCLVSWSIVTSRVVRDARSQLGFSDWSRWEHFSAINAFEESMEEALGTQAKLEAEFPFTVPEVVQAASFEDAFGRSLQRDGHICHFQSGDDWNALQAFLYPDKTWMTWRMVHFSQHLDLDLSCLRCLDLERTYPKTPSSHYHAPRLSLLIVRYIWLYFSGHPSYGWDDFSATFFISATRTRSDIPFISDLRLRMEFKSDAVEPCTPEMLYNPWVNTLHPRWRDSVTSLSLKEWQDLEWNFHEMWGNPFLTNSLVNPERDAIDVAVWVTYIFILVYTFSGKPLSVSLYSSFLSFSSGILKLPFNESTLPGHLSSRAESFCTRTEASGHTCAMHDWKQFSLNERLLYAAAYCIVFPHSSSIPLDYSTPQDFDDSCAGCLYESSTKSLDEAETHADSADTSAATRRVDAHVRRKLSKGCMLTELKDHFLMLLARHKIPVQYTNRNQPQLPWSTLPRILKEHALELVGWPSEVAPADSRHKYNPKGLMGLTAKDVKFLYEAMPKIDFRSSASGAGGRALVRPRDSESQDNVNLPPAKKAEFRVVNSGKMPLHKIQTFLFDVHACGEV